MPKRDHYSILGVPDDASVQAIKNAYSGLVRKVHPDTGNEPDPARFREVHEAYLTLSDAARRCSYDGELRRASRTSVPAEEIGARGPISVPDDLETEGPSLGEVMDQIAQNFFGFHKSAAGAVRPKC
jgi:DnaJ-class molecular chaperone